MSFYFFEPSYHKNNDMLRNQPYHSNYFERPIAPNAFMNNRNNRQSYPYYNANYYYNHPYNRNYYDNDANRDSNEDFVRDLREALKEEIKKENSTHKSNSNDDAEDNIVAFTFEIPTKSKSTEAKSELDTLYNLNQNTEESNAESVHSTIDSSIKTSSIPLQYSKGKENISSTEESNVSENSEKHKDEKERIYNMNELLRSKLNNYYIHEQGFQYTPRIDISEDEKTYHIYVDLPGLSKDQINIEISEDNLLKISGERKPNITHSSEENSVHYIINEREYGKFERSFILPGNANIENIQAKMENGVLEVSLNKKEIPKKQTRTIQIQ